MFFIANNLIALLVLEYNRLFFLQENNTDNTKDNLSKEEHVALKELKSKNEIVLQRPDKGAGVIILDMRDHDSKLLDLFSYP